MEDLRAEENFIKRIKQEYETEKQKASNKKALHKMNFLDHLRKNDHKRSVIYRP
jgi:ATPase subunit of ABC transporter with duplicated ATPase domains